MLRRLHSLTGLIAAMLMVVLATTGAILSLDPTFERARAIIPPPGQITVAGLAERVVAHYPGTEQIVRSPSGAVIVYYARDGRTGADLVNAETGRRIEAYHPSVLSRWIKDLHRSLLLDDPGRVVAGIGAALMVLLSVSGALMLVTRVGGWKRLLRPLRGTTSQRLHAELGRFAVLGLLLSALTGTYMSAVRFGMLPDAVQAEPGFPEANAGAPPAPLGTLPALAATELTDLRELVFPNPNDPTDVYSLRTEQGAGFIDQSTGKFLSFQPRRTAEKIQTFIYRLHTGEGLWWLGLILGLAALTVPVAAITGPLIWWHRRRSMPRLVGNCRAQRADTVILVGSEGNTTWGFAQSFHDSLTRSGHRVHTAPMNRLATGYSCAERLFILTATYGDGDAPASGNQFLKRLAQIPNTSALPYAVLGFGDRQFPRFCQFAKDVAAALHAKRWPQLQAPELIDRHGSQAFVRWGEAIGARIGTTLTLVHTVPYPRTTTLQLAERADYGAEVQAPTCVLRFKAPVDVGPARRLPRFLRKPKLPYFEAGDLVGILPPGGRTPRFYSLASASRDGILEICVRAHAGGLCSSFLHGLTPGATIQAYIQRNPHFRPAYGKAPVILIGAGTGIGPLTGFIRHNRARHPMYLYWGGRNPRSDFLYERELNTYLADRRLTGLNAAFSQIRDRAYVQDKIAADGQQLRRLVQMGAQILVCGGREMAACVMTALDEALAPLHLDVRTLKAEGRYREDVY